jgi:tungstate transport system ATP-binding protein
MTPLLEVRDLLVRRRSRTVLEVPTLDVERGEVLSLVGPNGAGKTTLLLALANLLKAGHGEIRFGGRPLSQWNALQYRRRLSFVFQVPLLLDMNVGDNLALGLKFRGLPQREICPRVDKWLQQLGIEALAKRPASELSGGEAQRVSLARAFVLEPELLLLDEPFPALDPAARAKLLEDLSALLAEGHCTAIFVTHNLREAARLGHRVAVIVAGKLRQVGPAPQIKAYPADEEVADFLREMPR